MTANGVKNTIDSILKRGLHISQNHEPILMQGYWSQNTMMLYGGLGSIFGGVNIYVLLLLTQLNNEYKIGTFQ